MAKVKNPILFSTHFGIDPAAFEEAGLIDPFLNVDTQLFIDPVLLEKSSHSEISKEALAAFHEHFSKFIRLLDISEKEGDAAWKGARKLLDLSEPPDNGLGYGGSRRGGASRPDAIREAIMRTSKDIIRLGSKDPDMLGLMGFFEENVGPDTISDFTTRVIVEALSRITEEFCKVHGVPTSHGNGESRYGLPSFDLGDGRVRTVILVPQDIVRELPIANDFSEVYAAIEATNRIRDRVNAFLGLAAKTSLTEKKAAVRKAALESEQLFSEFMGAIKQFATSYADSDDSLGYKKLKEILSSDPDQYKSSTKFNLNSGIEEVIKVVKETISMFQHHVEKGNLWEELWVNGEPKKERAAQLIYFAIADSFCRANNVDISPEANMGGGPIDFKFSHGYEARVLVEMKRSMGSVRHGYEKQLEHYKDAARTFHGIYVVIDFGDLGGKLLDIQQIRARRIAAGESASEIVVIDASPKASASKRK
ncbi:hypothetical protein [Pandoraea apista]|uniref:hypothetical protein n=1 Tax=Pandoraea apista TaxID=93218 RepID=UPI00065DF4E7|nr:hypothetical protein [Pandoraea apista]ALS64565.1 hypothetical protein AT395_05825 [Pandoraea apista]RRW88463.1 hypothetical protein EGJ54_24685 [Pandoraea apista]RRW96828.1 hypothetical protein EGJ56_24665 [Pandoraea apista]